MSAWLPVFPLPRVVLMPGALLPLHVFEPRYRALISHCLEHERMLGVATLLPGYEEDYYGNPAIYPEIGVGELVAHQPFPDGRCNVVLEYVGRVTMQAELKTTHPFRVVKGEVPDVDPSGAGPALLNLKMLVLQLGGLSPSAGDEARRLVDLDGPEMVDSLARKLLDDPDDQRRYLAADRFIERVLEVQDHLATFLTAADPAAEA